MYCDIRIDWQGKAADDLSSSNLIDGSPTESYSLRHGKESRIRRADLNPIVLAAKEGEYEQIGKEIRRLQPLGASRTVRYALRDENPWVEVRPENGAILVKKAFDYESLDQSKSIDFFVLINDTNTGGELLLFSLLFKLISYSRVMVSLESSFVTNAPLFIQLMLPISV